jgi:hypothetical protein
VIRLTVQPMPAPKPALRYQLLPELKEMNPGNPIEGYLRCFADPSVPEQRVFGASALREADAAARLDTPDWHILLQLKTGGFGLLLPDLQEMRNLASALKERFRTEVALRRFDDAFRTAKTMFAMSRHMGEHPTLIGDLVGIAIAFIAIEPLQEMLEQPGCPNLYWALTNLPDPLVPVVKGMAGERVLTASEFPDLDSTAPMSKEQIRKLIRHIEKALDTRDVRAFLDARIKDERLVSAARQRLVDAGFATEQLLGFPADQVIILDEMREAGERRDESMKFMNLPAWQVEMLSPEAKLKKWGGLFEGIVPALHNVRRAQGRLEQRIALLRHVEALRLYAAEHDGKLPEKLSDVAVPLPTDPFTGKPFHYQGEGSTAHLRGSPPPGREKEAVWNVHYEVTIQK